MRYYGYFRGNSRVRRRDQYMVPPTDLEARLGTETRQIPKVTMLRAERFPGRRLYSNSRSDAELVGGGSH